MTAAFPLSLNDPAPGQIGLVARPMNWFEREIERVTHSKVHHVITADPENDRVISPESQGVITRPMSWFPEAIWSAFPLTELQQGSILAFGRAQIGKPYAWADDFLIGIDLMLHRLAPGWLDDWFANDGQWQCAELADAEYRAAGLPLFDGRSPAAVFPGTFVPIWKMNGWWPSESDLASGVPPVAGV